MAKKQKNFFDITKAKEIGKKVVKKEPEQIPAPPRPKAESKPPIVEEQKVSTAPVAKAEKKKPLKTKTTKTKSASGVNTSAEKRHQKFRERKSYVYLDRALLEKAKKHALENGTTVSFLVEKYLKKLTSNKE